MNETTKKFMTKTDDLIDDLLEKEIYGNSKFVLNSEKVEYAENKVNELMDDLNSYHDILSGLNEFIELSIVEDCMDSLYAVRKSIEGWS